MTADDSAKLLRGIRTMDLRMNHSVKTGLEFIEYLKTNKKVSKIYHPSLKDHVGHEHFIKYFLNAPSLLSIALDKIYDQEQLAKMCNSFKLEFSKEKLFKNRYFLPELLANLQSSN